MGVMASPELSGNSVITVNSVDAESVARLRSDSGAGRAINVSQVRFPVADLSAINPDYGVTAFEWNMNTNALCSTVDFTITLLATVNYCV